MVLLGLPVLTADYDFWLAIDDIDDLILTKQVASPAQEIWEGLARHGRPIQYSYLPAPLAVWDTWTTIASRPVAFEAPSELIQSKQSVKNTAG